MDVEILEKKENPLLERTEVRFKLTYDGATPSRQNVRKKLVALLNADKKLTVVDSIDVGYGAKKAIGYAKVYANEQALKKEPEYILKRNAEEAKQEAPAEDTTAKTEEKSEAPAEDAQVKPDEKGGE
ncbi:MAG: 30S ribosomal protein S24e [Candidatus Altiarchaeota archaeon]|nr:30S ribosomal protein S24e [Candidatus Altiarchaeota archaeon]